MAIFNKRRQNEEMFIPDKKEKRSEQEKICDKIEAFTFEYQTDNQKKVEKQDRKLKELFEKLDNSSSETSQSEMIDLLVKNRGRDAVEWAKRVGYLNNFKNSSSVIFSEDGEIYSVIEGLKNKEDEKSLVEIFKKDGDASLLSRISIANFPYEVIDKCFQVCFANSKNANLTPVEKRNNFTITRGRVGQGVVSSFDPLSEEVLTCPVMEQGIIGKEFEKKFLLCLKNAPELIFSINLDKNDKNFLGKCAIVALNSIEEGINEFVHKGEKVPKNILARKNGLLNLFISKGIDVGIGNSTLKNCFDLNGVVKPEFENQVLQIARIQPASLLTELNLNKQSDEFIKNYVAEANEFYKRNSEIASDLEVQMLPNQSNFESAAKGLDQSSFESELEKSGIVYVENKSGINIARCAFPSYQPVLNNYDACRSFCAVLEEKPEKILRGYISGSKDKNEGIWEVDRFNLIAKDWSNVKKIAFLCGCIESIENHYEKEKEQNNGVLPNEKLDERNEVLQTLQTYRSQVCPAIISDIKANWIDWMKNKEFLTYILNLAVPEKFEANNQLQDNSNEFKQDLAQLGINCAKSETGYDFVYGLQNGGNPILSTEETKDSFINILKNDPENILEEMDKAKLPNDINFAVKCKEAVSNFYDEKIKEFNGKEIPKEILEQREESVLKIENNLQNVLSSSLDELKEYSDLSIGRQKNLTQVQKDNLRELLPLNRGLIGALRWAGAQDTEFVDECLNIVSESFNKEFESYKGDNSKEGVAGQFNCLMQKDELIKNGIENYLDPILGYSWSKDYFDSEGNVKPEFKQTVINSIRNYPKAISKLSKKAIENREFFEKCCEAIMENHSQAIQIFENYEKNFKVDENIKSEFNKRFGLDFLKSVEFPCLVSISKENGCNICYLNDGIPKTDVDKKAYVEILKENPSNFFNLDDKAFMDKDFIKDCTSKIKEHLINKANQFNGEEIPQSYFEETSNFLGEVKDKVASSTKVVEEMLLEGNSEQQKVNDSHKEFNNLISNFDF